MPDLARAISSPAAIEDLLDRSHVLPILPGPARGKIGITLLVVLVSLTTLPYLVDVPKGADADPATLLAYAAAPGARIITADGVQSVVAEAGDPQDPALLLIHGFGGSTFGYRDVMEPLAARGWHVIAIDLPGFGLSEKSWGRDYSHKAQATFALAVLDQLKVDRAVLQRRVLEAPLPAGATEHRHDAAQSGLCRV